MNTGTRILKKAMTHAQDLADMNQCMYVVFMPYMPSVYPAGRSPFFVERMPDWHDKDPEAWVKQQESQGAHIVRPRKKKDGR